jgi:hypothetical protein
VGERLFGPRSWLVIYLAAIVGGCLASSVWRPAGISVGASGGVFGVCSAVLGFALVRRDVLPRPVFRSLARTTGFFVVANLALTMAASVALPIDNAGHVGGLVAGFAVGALLSRELPSEPARERRRAALAGIPVVVLGLLFALCSSTAGPLVAGHRVFRDLFDAADQVDAMQTAADLASVEATLDGLRAESAPLEDPVKAALVAATDALGAYAEARFEHDASLQEQRAEVFGKAMLAVREALSR